MSKEVMYVESHEWVRKDEDGLVLLGLTDYAVEELGDLVFVNLPEEGDELQAGDSIGDVESVKAVSDVYSPVAGKVVAVNEDLLDAPDAINEAPMDTWLIKIDMGDADYPEGLMTEDAYKAFLETL